MPDGSQFNPLHVIITGPAGDVVTTATESPVSDGTNPTIKATVKNLPNLNAQAVILVNISGDVYNAGGGGGGPSSDVNINQIGGQSPDLNAGNAGAGTLRVVVASNQGAIPVTGSFTAQVTAPSFQTIGGLVGISGDSRVSQGGGWAVAITGDAANPINTKPGTGQTWPVREQGIVGVQIVGGGASGDLKITPSTTTFSRIPVSGDGYITDGANQGIKATVKSYTSSNPQAVVLVNSTGDAYSPNDRPKPIVSETMSGLNSIQGSRVIAVAAAGKRLWVTRYEFQSTFSKSYVHLAAGASGSQLTPRFILDPSVVGNVYASCPYPSGLFCTTPGGSLSLEMAGKNTEYSITYFTGDA